MKLIDRQYCLSRHRFCHRLGIILLFLLTVHVVSYIYVNISTDTGLIKEPNSRETRYVHLESDQHLKTKSPKSKPTILFWKPYNVGEDTSECMNSCPVQCKITQDKKDIEDADAVNFHLTNLWSDNWNIDSTATIDFPTYRRPDQIWSVTNLEPPPNLFGDLRVFNGVFNWTIWYRKDATLYNPYAYNNILSDNSSEVAEKELKKRNFYKEKTGNIIGMISNCKDAQHRYRLVAKMAKYLNIDMYGKCFDKVCGDPFNFFTCENITKGHKFYLGLENSRCRDYITEKYWHALERNQIPIVNWDFTHINRSIPIPGSFISINDFKSIKELAEYIEKVSNNETLYNSYFDWRKKYKIGYVCTACLICEALHKPKRIQTVVDFDGWVRDDVCAKVNKYNIRIRELHRSIFEWFGI